MFLLRSFKAKNLFDLIQFLNEKKKEKLQFLMQNKKNEKESYSIILKRGGKTT
jgi:hypothetical protein